MRRALLPLLCVALLASSSNAQQFVLSPQPRLVISGETDASAQFKSLLGVGRFASGEIALGTFDPVGIKLYSASGSLVRTLARPGEGPGEMRFPHFFGRRGDSVVTFDLGLRRVTFFAGNGGSRQTLVRLPAVRGRIPVVAGVLPGGALLVAQIPGLGRTAPDGPARDRHALLVIPADTAAAAVPLGEYAGYGVVYYTIPASRELSFTLDSLNTGTSYLVVGSEVAIADPDKPEVVFLHADGTVARRVALPITPRPFDPAAAREARRRATAVVPVGQTATRTAQDKARFDLMFDLSRRPKAAPYFRRLVRATDGSVWVEIYREHSGLPVDYLRIDPQGRVGGRVRGPANVQFHEFGVDYALGVQVDPDTDVQSVVLYALSRR